MRQTIPVRFNTTDGQESHESSSKGMPAQKASRTKNPIADIKPASKAMSSIASIQRMEGFFSWLLFASLYLANLGGPPLVGPPTPPACVPRADSVNHTNYVSSFNTHGLRVPRFKPFC